jgi:hypothetical protein
MTCDETLANLSAYLDGELAPGATTAVRAHLDDCPVCLAAERDLRALRGLLARLPRRPAPAGLAQEVEAELRRRSAAGGLWQTARRRRVRAGFQVAALAAGVILAVGIGTVVYLASHPSGGRPSGADVAAWDAEGPVGSPEEPGGGAGGAATGRFYADAARHELEDLADGGDAQGLRLGDAGLTLNGRSERWSSFGKARGWEADESYADKSRVARGDAHDRAPAGGRVGGHSLTGDLYAYYDRRRETAFNAKAPAMVRKPAPAEPGPPPSSVGAVATADAGHATVAGALARNATTKLTNLDLKKARALPDGQVPERTIVLVTDSRERFGAELAGLLAEGDSRLTATRADDAWRVVGAREDVERLAEALTAGGGPPSPAHGAKGAPTDVPRGLAMRRPAPADAEAARKPSAQAVMSPQAAKPQSQEVQAKAEPPAEVAAAMDAAQPTAPDQPTGPPKPGRAAEPGESRKDPMVLVIRVVEVKDAAAAERVRATLRPAADQAEGQTKD